MHCLSRSSKLLLTPVSVMADTPAECQKVPMAHWSLPLPPPLPLLSLFFPLPLPLPLHESRVSGFILLGSAADIEIRPSPSYWPLNFPVFLETFPQAQAEVCFSKPSGLPRLANTSISKDRARPAMTAAAHLDMHMLTKKLPHRCMPREPGISKTP